MNLLQVNQPFDLQLKSKLEIFMKNDWFTRTFDLAKLKLLGKGSFGDVISIFHKKFNRTIALKIIEAKEDDLNQVINELIKIKILQHENILETLEHNLIIHNNQFFLLLVMEEGFSSLDHYIRKLPIGMNEGELCEIMMALSSALSYAHKKKIVHCDIKPSNIILYKSEATLSYIPKISDWGSAYEFKEINHDSDTTILPPELHIIFEEKNAKKKRGNFFAFDVYALGITLLRCGGITMEQMGGMRMMKNYMKLR